jgi:NADPH:quinone reductase-like Zn-dependent oxidoreductase
MTNDLPKTRRVFRRTDDYTPGTPKVKLVSEALPELTPTSVLIKVHTISLNYRDANIANGGNPWPVTPNGKRSPMQSIILAEVVLK